MKTSAVQFTHTVAPACRQSYSRIRAGCLFVLAIFSTSACGPVISHKEGSSPIQSAFSRPQGASKCTPDQAKAILKEAGKDALYGEGVGKVALNVAAIIVFPPFAIYRLGQAGASLFGYRVDVTNALPEPAEEGLSTAYSAVSSVPGRAAAVIADEEYRGGVDPLATLNEQSRCASPAFANQMPKEPPAAVVSKETIADSRSVPASSAILSPAGSL